MAQCIKALTVQPRVAPTVTLHLGAGSCFLYSTRETACFNKQSGQQLIIIADRPCPSKADQQQHGRCSPAEPTVALKTGLVFLNLRVDFMFRFELKWR